MQVLQKHLPALKNLRGVHHVDLGYKYKAGRIRQEIAIRIHVYRKHSKSLLGDAVIPREIEGIPTDVIVSHPVKHSRRGKRFPSLTGGIVIQNIFNPDRGTLGAVLFNENNERVGLSNYHVLFGDKGRAGDAITQPESAQVIEEDIIGTLVNGVEALDCAIFRLNEMRPADEGILDLCPTILDHVTPRIGDAVVKSGVTTEVTFGIIEGRSPDHRLTISANPRKPNPEKRLASPGDSGALWMIDEGDVHFGVGLHFAAEADGTKAYAYALPEVNNALRIHF